MKKALLTIIISVSWIWVYSQSSINGSLTASSPTFNRPLEDMSGLSSYGTNVYYSVLRLTVTTTGTKTIDCVSSLLDPTDPDSFGFLYGPGGFNPASPLTNLIAADDDKDYTGGDYDFQINYNFTATGTYYVVVTTYSNDVTGAFTVTSTAGSVLPLKLMSFTAEKANGTSMIKWTTVQEENIASFEVQRGINGKTFQPVGTVEAANTSLGKSYSFTDMKPVNGINYYRLSIIGRDGSRTYSQVIALNHKNKEWDVSIFPNPSTNYINVQLIHAEKTNVVYAVVNSNGQVVLKGTKANFSGNVFSVDVQSLPKGSYYIKLTTTAEGETITPFIKQ
jgi:hypothetical protein